MSFLIFQGAPVCAFLIYCATLLFPSCMQLSVYAFLIYYTTLFFPPCISFQVSKFKIFDSIPYLAPLASIRIIEHKNPISDERPISFVIYLGALVCAFLINCTSLFFPSCISPQISNFNFSNCIAYLAPLALIGMVEFKKPIAHEQPMSFLFYYGALVCTFLSYCTYLFFS